MYTNILSFISLLHIFLSRWAGGFINYGYPLRVRHITTGRYLAYNENREVCLVTKEQASVEASSFGLRQNKVNIYCVVVSNIAWLVFNCDILIRVSKNLSIWK